MKKLSLFLGLLLCSCLLFAQGVTLKGTVTDADSGEPLAFVNVSVNVDGNLKGAQTDFDGNYSIDITAGERTVVFSFIGYKSEEISKIFVDGDVQTLNVTMAEEQELLDAVVVTGGKFEQKLGEQTVSLAVIKPSLVESANNTSIDQTLEKVPGVDIVDGQANIRGGSGYSYGAGSRVQLLMDDLPVLTADAGFPNWDFLPIENLEQVEIIKGAASALYGSSAMNGIINLRTAYPKSKPYTKVSMFTGIYQNPRFNFDGAYEFLDTNGDVINDDDGNRVLNSSEISPEQLADSAKILRSPHGNVFPFEAGFSIAHRQKFGNLDLVSGAYLLNRDRWRSNNYERRARGNVNLRYRLQKVAGMSFGLNTNAQVNTSASYLVWNYNEEGPGIGGYDLWSALPVINNKGLKVTVDPFMEYFHSPSGIKVKFQGRYFKNNNQNDTDQSTNSDFFYGETQFQKRWEDIDLTITTGVASSLAKANAELYLGDGKYDASNVGVYAQIDKKFWDKLNVSVGGRFERNEIEGDIESKPVVRAGINYQPADYTFIRASYGQAYRFPTIAEKFVQTDLGVIDFEFDSGLSVPIALGIFPNQELKSETGWSAEIGVKQGFAIGDWKGFIDASGFINEYNDMMEFTFGISEALRSLPPVQEVFPLDTVSIVVGEGSAAGFQSINIGNTRIFGGDFSIAGQGKIGRLPLGLLAGYTVLDPKFQNFDKNQDQLSSADYNVLKYRFRHTIKLDAEIEIGKFAIGVSYRGYSFMEAIDEAFNVFLPGIRDFREKHDGWTNVIDTRLNIKMSERATLGLIVQNLGNAEYALRPGLMDAPRNFTIKYTHDLSKRD